MAGRQQVWKGVYKYSPASRHELDKIGDCHLFLLLSRFDERAQLYHRQQEALCQVS